MKYEAGGLSIEVFSQEAFWIDLLGKGAPFARTELTELRHIIDQAQCVAMQARTAYRCFHPPDDGRCGLAGQLLVEDRAGQRIDGIKTAAPLFLRRDRPDAFDPAA